MHIEINAGGLGAGIAVAEYQLNMSDFISDTESIISSFKAVNNKVHDLSGGIGSLQSAVDEISSRIRIEEEKKEAAAEIRKKSNDFLDLAIRVDKQVASLVNKNKDEFYKTNPWLKPAVDIDDTPWYEDAWNWLDETFRKAWDAITKTPAFQLLFGPGYWLYSIFSENEFLNSIWSDTKSKLKAIDLFEEVFEILGEDFGDKPEVLSVLGYLTKVEKIFKAIDDPTSSDNWIDAIEAFLKMCGLKDWVSSGMGGISGSEAGLIIDLVVSDVKNLLENTGESVSLIQELINNPDATIADYLKTFSYIRYNLGDGVLVEGFCDVVLDKADIIGFITGMNNYAERVSGGQYSKVSDVYYDFVDLYKSNVESFGTKKAIEIYLDAFADSFKDSISPRIGPIVSLFAK